MMFTLHSASGEDQKLPEFQDLFLRYYQPALRFFQRKGFSEADAADLVQETFLRAYKSGDNYQGFSSVATWFFGIARHVALTEVRNRTAQKRDARQVSLDALDVSTSEEDSIPERWWGDPLEEVLATERVRLLRGALDALPPQMRHCVHLRLDQDLKYREIAEVMRISIETVKAHLFQARKQLKEKLAPYFDDFDSI